MVRSALLLPIPLLLAIALPAPGQESGLAALEAASARYATFQTICADFRQRLENPLLDEEKTSSGRLCQRRPNLFRMDFSDPDGDEVVADGAHFWLFYKSLNPDQVLQFPLDPERGGLDFFREFLLDPTSKYEVVSEGRESIDGFLTWRLSLTPRTPRGLASARVWVDPEAALIRRIEVVDDNGLLRRVDLSDMALDPALAPDHFTFTVPPGVDVVSNG
jgi:outer membrane lipoprotein carrier protein